MKNFLQRLTPLFAAVFTASTLALICQVALAAEADTAVEPGKRFPFFQSEPVSFLNVKMQDLFWAPRQKIVREVTVPWATRHYDEAGGLDEFKKNPKAYKAKLQPGDFEAIKFVEAMAAAVGLQRDQAIEGLTDAWADKLIQGQAADGYLTFASPGGENPTNRWKAAPNSNEDYAVGHYLESALGYRESTGSRPMYESAVRAADNMASAFLETNRTYAPGHSEIEQALMRLYEATGKTKYLRLCGSLIGQRGFHDGRPDYGMYSQDHMPIKDQRTIEGHAVRAAFLFNAVTEYVGATGDAAYRQAALSVWDDFASRKMFFHGAGGNRSANNEGYSTKPYYIPPDDCYGESCSVFGNFQWAHNLFRLTGDADYIDAAERMLYNAFYASLSLEGSHFFNSNSAQADAPSQRSEWAGTPCCPPNIAKLFCKVGGFFYSTDSSGIFVKHYGASTADIPFAEGVKLTQRTDYPWNGNIAIQVDPKQSAVFALRLRLPAWAKSYRIMVNGKTVEATSRQGWLVVRRQWRQGDKLELSMPMSTERVTLPQRFKEYETLAAFQRGPMVYCLEEQDVAAPLDSLYIPVEAKFTAEKRTEFLGGATVLRGNLQQVNVDGSEASVPAMFVPYGVWNNRQPGEMRIWLSAQKMVLPDLLPRASHTGATDSVNALNDRVLPADSSDQSIPRWTWGDHKGSDEWARYSFSERVISGVEVYWFQDAIGCRTPESWKVQYWDGAAWRDAENPGSYGIELNQFNTVDFTPVKTTQLRLSIVSQKDFAGGILEWRLRGPAK